MNLIRKAKKQVDGMARSVSGSLKGELGRGHEGKTFLHGHLLIEVRGGRNLPDLEGFLSKLVDKKDVTDPFVDVRLGRAKIAKTR